MVAVTLVAATDDAAGWIARLFDAHQHALYRLARRLADTAEDAQDLVQETFLRAARDPGRVPVGHEQEEAWLVRALVNLRRDQWRQTKVRSRTAPLVQATLSPTSSSHESAVMARHEIWKALNTLRPRRRAVLILHELEGASIAGIASLLGISVITVRWHLSRGRRDLRRILRPQMGETR
jgi:RNA polymerase sigma-70 factor, ECF subfamily